MTGRFKGLQPQTLLEADTLVCNFGRDKSTTVTCPEDIRSVPGIGNQILPVQAVNQQIRLPSLVMQNKRRLDEIFGDFNCHNLNDIELKRRHTSSPLAVAAHTKHGLIQLSGQDKMQVSSESTECGDSRDFPSLCPSLIKEDSWCARPKLDSLFIETINTTSKFETPKIEEFLMKEKLGEGTYGVVHRALHQPTGVAYAIKKLKIDIDEEGCPSLGIREISLLKRLCPYCILIVDLKHIITSKEKWEDIYLVFEIMSSDLRTYIKNAGAHNSRKTFMGFPVHSSLADDLLSDNFTTFGNHQPSHGYINSTATGIFPNYTSMEAKYISYQICLAVDFCHSQRIMHRDIKPQNILIDMKTGRAKLGDFGLARWMLKPATIMTHEIVTLWYRAPEILMGAPLYDYTLDIWSIGCVIAELVAPPSPLFAGDSEIDTLFRIFNLRGTADPKCWPEVANFKFYLDGWPKWTDKGSLKFMDDRATSAFVDVLPEVNELILSCVSLIPNERPPSYHILERSWFSDIDSEYVISENFVCPSEYVPNKLKESLQ